jgi:hypothetical protein
MLEILTLSSEKKKKKSRFINQIPLTIVYCLLNSKENMILAVKEWCKLIKT